MGRRPSKAAEELELVDAIVEERGRRENMREDLRAELAAARAVGAPPRIIRFLEGGLQSETSLLRRSRLVDELVAGQLDPEALDRIRAPDPLDAMKDRLADLLIERGSLVLGAVRKSIVRRRETTPNQAGRYAKMQLAINAERRKHPTASFTVLSKRVAKSFSCSARTIRNHTHEPATH